MAIMFVMSPWLRVTKRRACFIIVGTWLFSLIMALPLLIVNQVNYFNNFINFNLRKKNQKITLKRVKRIGQM